MGTYPELKLYINGEWRQTPDTIPVVNPATEEELSQLPHARISDLEDALAAAEKGFEIWRNTSPRARSDIILHAAAIMRERQEKIAQSITAEHGKPLAQARLEVIRGVEFFEWDAGEALRTYGRVIPAAPGSQISVHHHPIGVVAAFSPWNFPMSQPARKIAGALASGCSPSLDSVGCSKRYTCADGTRRACPSDCLRRHRCGSSCNQLCRAQDA